VRHGQTGGVARRGGGGHRDGVSIGTAGFGAAHRFPSSLIIALLDKGSSGLTIYCNGLGQSGFPTVHLLADSNQIGSWLPARARVD
jgi:acyl CoA:acetate/3-ketoacid CoA transferase alpha subunit